MQNAAKCKKVLSWAVSAEGEGKEIYPRVRNWGSCLVALGLCGVPATGERRLTLQREHGRKSLMGVMAGDALAPWQLRRNLPGAMTAR